MQNVRDNKKANKINLENYQKSQCDKNEKKDFVKWKF